jgi:hypothetical protein
LSTYWLGRRRSLERRVSMEKTQRFNSRYLYVFDAGDIFGYSSFSLAKAPRSALAPKLNRCLSGLSLDPHLLPSSAIELPKLETTDTEG